MITVHSASFGNEVKGQSIVVDVRNIFLIMY